MMLPMLMGASGGAVVNPIPVTNIEDNEVWPASAYAQVYVQNDGTLWVSGDASVGGPNWFAPAQAGIGTGYWVRVTKNSGTNNTGGSALGVWLSLTGSLFWGWSKATMGTIVANIDIDIATDALGANIVASKASVPVSVSTIP